MISLCVIAKHGAKSFQRLIDSAAHHCREILVALDDGSEEGILGYGSAKYFHRPLNGDFSAQRNYLLDHASGQWALHLDTDENLNLKLWSQIAGICENTSEDLIMLPRHTRFEDRPEHMCDWPDWQPKLHRIKPELRWRRPVHEWPSGFNGQLFLPADMDHAIIHVKTTAAQEVANRLYERIIAQ